MEHEVTVDLDLVTIRVTARLQGNVAERCALFACRSKFESAFRKACGCRGGECLTCRSVADCPYPAHFAQALSCDPDAVRRHQKPPLPFVLSFPLLPPSPNRGSEVGCLLTLFGTAIQSLATFFTALTILLEELGMPPVKSEAVSQDGGGVAFDPAGSAGSLPVLSAGDLGSLLPADRLTLSLVTPLRVLQDGRALRRLEFAQLVRPLMRRASAVACYYAGAELPWDYRWLSAQSARVETAAADCRYVEWGAKVSGILGRFTFAGDLEPFHPLLRLGEVLHVGKNAAFGQGELRIER